MGNIVEAGGFGDTRLPSEIYSEEAEDGRYSRSYISQEDSTPGSFLQRRLEAGGYETNFFGNEIKHLSRDEKAIALAIHSGEFNVPRPILEQ